jgi:hypothetical protein
LPYNITSLKKKKTIGLCEVKFSEVNLPVAVTLKAIYDLRHTWMLRRTAQLEAKKQAALQARKTGSDAETDLSIISVDKEEDSKARVTTLVQNGELSMGGPSSPLYELHEQKCKLFSYLSLFLL